MMNFKDWYTAKHGAFPGVEGEFYTDMFSRLANAFAEYVDEVVAVRLPDRGAPTATWRPDVDA
jgi:hypothetical protein